jgi:hypothetical protein
LLYTTVFVLTVFGYYIYFTKIAPYQSGCGSNSIAQSSLEDVLKPRPKLFSRGNLPPIQRPESIEKS